MSISYRRLFVGIHHDNNLMHKLHVDSYVFVLQLDFRQD